MSDLVERLRDKITNVLDEHELPQAIHDSLHEDISQIAWELINLKRNYIADHDTMPKEVYFSDGTIVRLSANGPYLVIDRNNDVSYVAPSAQQMLNLQAVAEIERLTADLNHALIRAEIAEAQRDALRATVEQYEQAPVVGWYWWGRTSIMTWPIFDLGTDRPERAPDTAIPLIARPESKNDRT